jgi:hypothetical protein
MSSNNSDFLTKNKEFEKWNRGSERTLMHMERTFIMEGGAEVK